MSTTTVLPRNTMGCIQCAAHGALSCQETVGTCGTCRAQNVDINRYRQSGTPEALCLTCLAAGKHMESAHDPTKADVETITHLAARPVGQGGFEPLWDKGHNDEEDES